MTILSGPRFPYDISHLLHREAMNENIQGWSVELSNIHGWAIGPSSRNLMMDVGLMSKKTKCTHTTMAIV